MHSQYLIKKKNKGVVYEKRSGGKLTGKEWWEVRFVAPVLLVSTGACNLKRKLLLPLCPSTNNNLVPSVL